MQSDISINWVVFGRDLPLGVSNVTETSICAHRQLAWGNRTLHLHKTIKVNEANIDSAILVLAERYDSWRRIWNEASAAEEKVSLLIRACHDEIQTTTRIMLERAFENDDRDRSIFEESRRET